MLLTGLINEQNAKYWLLLLGNLGIKLIQN
jgi:hypothetical protein